jgi:hypothetical protein
MSTFAKASLTFGASMFVGAFKAFALTLMWNWFVSPIFHTSNISFWEMLGLLWVVQLFVDKSYAQDPAEKIHWENLFLVLDACVPAEKREDLKADLKEKEGSIWSEVGGQIFGQLVGYAFTLGLGFLLHTFFIGV